MNLRQICLKGGDRRVTPTTTADELRERVLVLAAGLSERKERFWGIWYRDAADFLSGFLALALSGKHIVMPQNLQPGNEALMARQFEILLTDHPDLSLRLPQCTPDDICSSARFPPSSTQYDFQQQVSLTLYTSGSTGDPCAIQKTLASLEAEVTLLQQCFGTALGVATVLSTVSHQHIYGLLHAVLWPFVRGAPFDNERHSYPESLADALRHLSSAVLVSSPTHLSRLPYSSVFSDQADRLVDIVSSGGLLAEKDALACAEFCAHAPLEVLGSTETGGVATRRRNQTPYWQCLPGVELSISQNGCLRVYGPHMGLNTPFVMGDLVRLVGEDRFELLGRADRIVKLEGKRLSLTEMETRLAEQSWVTDARLLVMSARREEVVAVVSLTSSGLELLQSKGKLRLNQMLRNYLAAYFEAPLLPRRWRYVSTVPSNDQGKVTQEALRELFKTKVD